jgi:3-hydroxybutyryl-CoA dehydratase
MKLPGTGTIYIGQQMSFKRPTRIGDKITARVEVIEKQDERERVVLSTICINQDGDVVLDGQATVALMRE